MCSKALSLSLSLVALPAEALAWTCPSETGYAAPWSHAWLPTDQIPAPTWPDPYDDESPGACDDATPPSWCSENLAMVPAGAYDRGGPMVLWLPGKGADPSKHEIVLKTAAYAGYRTVGLAFDNLYYTRAEWCDVEGNGTTLKGGVCGDGCQFATGFEMLDGVDDAATPYPAHRMRSIKGRLSLALNDLYLKDLDDGTNDHQWDDFCTYDAVDGTVVHYDEMIVSGFSAGGQMAQFISYVEPVVGLFAVEAGADYCEYNVSSPSTVGYPDEYDDHAGYPPCADDVVDSGDTGLRCDADARRVAVHEDGDVFGLLAHVDDNLEQVGIDTVEHDVDPELDTGLMPDFDYNLFSTAHAVPNGCSAHEAMAEDGCMATPAFLPTIEDDPEGDDAYLFPAYLQAYCDVGP